MQKHALLIVSAFLYLMFAATDVLAQNNVTYEVRNCTDVDLCVVSFPITPFPPGCPPVLEVCGGPTILGANSTLTRTIDTDCRILSVSLHPSNSDVITSLEGSRPFGKDYCACWDFSGINPILTIYEGDCIPLCPAPACP